MRKSDDSNLPPRPFKPCIPPGDNLHQFHSETINRFVTASVNGTVHWVRNFSEQRRSRRLIVSIDSGIDACTGRVRALFIVID
jgi:hypothetical protein